MEETVSVKDELNSDMGVLRRLSEHDAEIAKLRGFEEGIPRSIEMAREGCEKAEEAVRSAEKNLEELQKELREKEGEAKDFQQQIISRRSKLTDVKTNKEYAALLAEADALKEKTAENEDRQLAIMESLEGLNKEIKEKKSELETEKKNFEEVKKQKELEQGRLKEAIADETAKRDDVLTRLDPEIAQMYERLVSSDKRNAIVGYKAQACQACFARITPQDEIRLRRGKDIIPCPQCNRFLYWME